MLVGNNLELIRVILNTIVGADFRTIYKPLRELIKDMDKDISEGKLTLLESFKKQLKEYEYSLGKYLYDRTCNGNPFVYQKKLTLEVLPDGENSDEKNQYYMWTWSENDKIIASGSDIPDLGKVISDIYVALTPDIRSSVFEEIEKQFNARG
ncbi:hypothetical protein OFN97_05515 [Campylobacter sp. VBCF_05 NA6]|uniref:hypothetical protein n=1 Tax=unclassified Campylobacter TaxID=2593542 RepID=UPI0022E9A7FF|nr:MULTISPECIES: hypothetical protein [unclassified Campylobacter]MDA3057098.1 hypothetical protein [Campylobacter sp. VBCF_04 NA7]MDA3059472.1 hypothetical protein [Campylobacter sp. VBCF_05 NA6]